ncbi:hypothetical protein J4P02_12590 [Pseudomonas sp. NFXW11]|uniref:hypothetical protein n=1 Tax=Pseudomonas sp. NFXW11 TaxID=2819531 RepID=UPI003CEF9DB7
MEQIFWRDIEDLAGHWNGLGVDVPGPARGKPNLRLLSGDNRRMQLVLGEQTLLWGTMSSCLYGVWLVRNHLLEHLPQTLVGPIDSPQVEQQAGLAPSQRLKAWSRFFVQQLRQHQAEFFYPGYWLVRALRPASHPYGRARLSGIDTWYFKGGDDALSHLPNWSIDGRNILDNQQPGPARWVELWEGGGAVVGLHGVDPLAGRLKWWRKKAREGSLPPILLWYVSGLNSYLILDGHYRLQAAIDENLPPEFLVLSSPRVSSYAPNPQEQQKVLGALQVQVQRNKLDTGRLNQLLISTFDDRPYHGFGSQSWAAIASQQEWVEQVSAILAQRDDLGELENILEREAPEEFR